MKPEWRTNTVVELCRSMREAQDWSALPILADALQDANCDDESLLADLRAPAPARNYVRGATLVARVMSAETEEAVSELKTLADNSSGPHFDTLLPALVGRHEENDAGDAYHFSERSEWDEDYLHFNGSDAHGAIPPRMWELAELVTGARIGPDRPSSFSCSC